MDADANRRAHNEAAFREVNERIAEVGETFVPEGMSLLCECSRHACVERVWVDVSEYERVRAQSECFILRPGHEQLDIEVVVEEWPGVIVVRKRGEAAEISRDTDPRSN